MQNVFIQAAKELFIQHEEIKNRVSRPGSITNLVYNPEKENKVNLESEEEENRQNKKFCCF